MSTSRKHSQPEETQAVEPAKEELARGIARLRVLSEISREFAAATDSVVLLATITRAVADLIGDGCSITLLDPTGESLTRVASAHRDAALDVAWRQTLADVAIPKEMVDSVVAAVTRSGMPEYVPNVAPQRVVDRASELLKPLVRRLNVHSFLAVPVRARESILGALTLMRSGPGRPYTPDDLTLLGEIADRAGLAIQNARLFEQARAHAAELAAANATLRQHAALVDGISEAVISLDPHLHIRTWNRGAQELLGWTCDEVVGKGLVDLVGADRVDPGRERVLRILFSEGSWSGDRLYRRKDGALVSVHVSASALKDERGQLVGMLVIAGDLGKKQEAERAMRQLATIVESSTDAIVSATLDGVVLTWNRASEQLFGYSADEMIGRSIVCLVPEERRAELSVLDKEIRVGAQPATLETVRVRKDGSRLDVSITLSPIIDGEGKSIGVSAVIRDITQRRKLEQQVMMSERLASVGMLAAGVAHEINNPLAYVMGNLELVLRQLGEIEAVLPARAYGSITQMLDDACNGTERIARIVQGLQTFARAERAPDALLSLQPVLETAVSLAQNQLKHGARLVRDYAVTPLVMGDEGRLVQVFVNLLVNAAHALNEAQLSDSDIQLITRADERGRAVVEVRDSGPGIPEAIREHVFDAFFTTKPVGSGTGLGLSISHNIVTAHGGEITFESEIGRGTTFRVTLPAANLEARRAAREEPARHGGEPVRRGRVLVVDDEPMIGRFVSAVLAAEHDVSACAGGAEVLQRIRAGERFDAILCDLMMPSVTGMDVYNELKQIAPDQAERMIFVTGGAFTDTSKKFMDSVPNTRLDKPFSASRLRELSRSFVR